jgi:hypothetical protein
MKKTLIIFLLFTGMANAQIIDFFKDLNFKNALLLSNPANPIPIATDIDGVAISIDANKDGEIEISEALRVYTMNVQSSNIISLVGINNFSNLLSIDCSGNNIEMLDLSNLFSLNKFKCDNNPLLRQLFLKNGRNKDFTGSSFSGCPNLVYICIDEFDINAARTAASGYGYGNCVINSYCSFTPGGKFNTLNGNVRFDFKSDGCDTSDATFINFKINTTQFAANGDQIKETIFVKNSGDYISNQENPKLAISPSFENPTYFTSSPSKASVDFSSNPIQKQDFCMTAKDVYNDLEVVVSPVIDARPGFDAKYQLVFKNKGNQKLSGDVSLSFDESKIKYVAAVPNISNQSINMLTWNYTNLLPFETRTIDITVNIQSNVNVGDILKFNAKITPETSDNLPKDNSFTYVQKVANTLGQNTITCLQGETIANTDDYLHYKINFENIIEEDIKNVVIENEIDPNAFDLETIQILKSSNDVEVSLKKNILKFVYQGITLRRATAGNPKTGGGTGGVLMKIIPKSTIISGNTLSNNANVFFDYNAPIGTNTASTLYLNSTLNIEDIKTDSSINIYPNPVKNIVNINANNIIQSIQLYDAQGRLLQIKYQDKNQTNLDLSTRAKGIYFLKITTQNGVKIEKIVKE